MREPARRLRLVDLLPARLGREDPACHGETVPEHEGPLHVPCAPHARDDAVISEDEDDRLRVVPSDVVQQPVEPPACRPAPFQVPRPERVPFGHGVPIVRPVCMARQAEMDPRELPGSRFDGPDHLHQPFVPRIFGLRSEQLPHLVRCAVSPERAFGSLEPHQLARGPLPHRQMGVHPRPAFRREVRRRIARHHPVAVASQELEERAPPAPREEHQPVPRHRLQRPVERLLPQ